MLIRSHDRGRSDEQWKSFIERQGFGHLAVNADPFPVVVPTQFVRAGDEILLHLAASNPIFAALATSPQAVLSVAGDWAYIPGQWKAIDDEDPSLGIPTTYYAAVQICGKVSVVDTESGIAEVLRSQLANVQPEGGLVDPAEHAPKFAAIRGLRLSIDDVRSKFKYGGNADEPHRAAVAERLRARGAPGDVAAAAHIETRSERD